MSSGTKRHLQIYTYIFTSRVCAGFPAVARHTHALKEEIYVSDTKPNIADARGLEKSTRATSPFAAGSAPRQLRRVHRKNAPQNDLQIDARRQGAVFRPSRLLPG